jgi:hypothetical protein
MTCDIDKINRPSRLRRAIGFDLSYSSTSKASPNDTGIVIIVIIIVGEVVLNFHGGGIIAQSLMALDFFHNFTVRRIIEGWIPCVRVGQMWDINPCAMQSNCKV